VIYHDFLLSESGTDAPVHAVTAAQFHAIGLGEVLPSPRPRSRSAGDPYVAAAHRAGDARMAQTRDIQDKVHKGYKGNSFGSFIKSPFATLSDLFETLPEDLSFNIEMKYPTFGEAQAEDMLATAPSINIFVDTVLKTVFDLAGGRKIVFSSFHPDMCIALAKKQRVYPVLFLTDAGTSFMADRRGQSLREGVRHARRWALAGVVSAAAPLVACPRLVGKVKREGLVCATYGEENNEPALVKVCG
jgi:glycerophosphodiester phosphodiesterase